MPSCQFRLMSVPALPCGSVSSDFGRVCTQYNSDAGADEFGGMRQRAL